MDKTEIQKRISLLRDFMRNHGLSAFIIPSTDPHAGEYVPEFWESRKWISGFAGSAGTVVIATDSAGLWTDSRYFLQAEKDLEDTGITLYKERMPETPSIADWILSNFQEGNKVGIDGFVNSTSSTLNLSATLNKKGIQIMAVADPFSTIWTDRPSLPPRPAFVLPLEYCGESSASKIERIRTAYSSEGADGILISALDEIAWTLNMRGTDIHCNPVFISYLLITNVAITLFISNSKLDASTCKYLKDNHISTAPYEETANAIRNLSVSRLQMSGETNYTLFLEASKHYNVLLKPSPVLHMKAIKNETEIDGFHHAMLRDGVAMVRFIMWLKEIAHQHTEDEYTIDQKLYSLRAEQEGFRCTSFDTIAGYEDHGAIVHYEATSDSAYKIKDKGLLLLDSGAQYTDGTTDITRTIVLGDITEEQKRDYTLVLKGMIGLAMAEFPHGTCGTQLDALARIAMWKYGINYGHGTGHGVGHYLNVHEGPHQIRMNHMPALLTPGMTVTNEPGIYKAGKYGIRTENTMLVVPARETEFGKFYKFEQLTLCPIDKEAIATDLLNEEERLWLNHYHQMVFEKLSPLVNETERQWLKQATSKI